MALKANRMRPGANLELVVELVASSTAKVARKRRSIWKESPTKAVPPVQVKVATATAMTLALVMELEMQMEMKLKLVEKKFDELSSQSTSSWH